MKAQLITYSDNRQCIIQVKNVEISDNYEGNPYENVGFSIGSNQFLRTDSDLFTEEMDIRLG